MISAVLMPRPYMNLETNDDELINKLMTSNQIKNIDQSPHYIECPGGTPYSPEEPGARGQSCSSDSSSCSYSNSQSYTPLIGETDEFPKSMSPSPSYSTNDDDYITEGSCEPTPSPETCSEPVITIAPTIPQPHLQPPSRTYSDISSELPTFVWQKSIQNEKLFGAFYPHFQKEIMNNPFYSISAQEYNDTLSKCKFLKSRWIGKSIRSNKGQIIKESELFALKMYTDYERCQRELKKCYRTPSTNWTRSDVAIYEQRLSYFHHWKRLLNSSMQKYGVPLGNKVFYHGINRVMHLDIHPTGRLQGPFSASSEFEIARGFASQNGVILKMMSKYPRLSDDYYFDATPISAYPEEKELLIGSVCTRILKVCLSTTDLSIKKQCIERLCCFVISSLISNHIYSYGQNLELIFKALLMSNDEFTEKHLLYVNKEEMNKIKKIANLIPQCITDEFKRVLYGNRDGERSVYRKVLKLDRISDGLKRIFYARNNHVSYTGKTDTMPSLYRIYEYMPGVSHLQLDEGYEMNDHFITHFIDFIKLFKGDSSMKLKSIKICKHNFNGDCRQFEWLQSLTESNRIQIEQLGWTMKQCYDSKGNWYRFELSKKQ